MIWFWFGFFAFVAVLLALDLGVLHRKATTPTIRSAAYWTAGWMALGFSFTGVVYLMYDNAWLGATLVEPSKNPGVDGAIMYVSAYLLEYALSVDNIFVISLLFLQFRVPSQYQHRVLFWGIMGAIVFRLIMLAGGAYVANKFDWVFYVFGAYLAFQGIKLLKPESEEEQSHDKNFAVRMLRRVIPIVDSVDHGGKFIVHLANGKRALTTIAVCLVSIELTDIVFALDSIPAVLSVSKDIFIMVTSNIFAIMGLRSLYFVLAGAMDQFRYLKIALAILLIVIGAKMVAHNHFHVPHAISLALIAGIIGTGVIASIVANRRELAKIDPDKPVDPAHLGDSDDAAP
ncbi:MAG: TerC/Alx family metal homeostasis membrane protein [Deltaproteobacteria bacterium]|nr:TerC/Alx family metal homeostasis membrane protein [Deltaproteobacteria bacterium]MDQ3299219.1 TerC/Alx family metal homeostasis membrane protein [Myxococcota bacterium]